MGIGSYEVPTLEIQSCENSQKLGNIFQVFFRYNIDFSWPIFLLI
jgi:hypothetical protein